MHSWTDPGNCLGQPSSCWSHPRRAEGEDRDPPQAFLEPPRSPKEKGWQPLLGMLGRERRGIYPRECFLTPESPLPSKQLLTLLLQSQKHTGSEQSPAFALCPFHSNAWGPRSSSSLLDWWEIHTPHLGVPLDIETLSLDSLGCPGPRQTWRVQTHPDAEKGVVLLTK